MASIGKGHVVVLDSPPEEAKQWSEAQDPEIHDPSQPEELKFDAETADPNEHHPAPEHVIGSVRTAEDNKKIWGGKMVDSIKAVEGNFSLFSDECLSIHGLYDAFYSRNGWCRTLVYLVFWTAVGCFFVYLTVPLVADFNKKTLTTSVDFEEGTTVGLPLPIITVCPHGSGYRCDCLLWRQLHCRYLEDVPNQVWRERFNTYACLDDFERMPKSGDVVWTDPRCEDFGENATLALEDPCIPTERESEVFPGARNITTEFLFDAVVARENSTNGPYISYAELAVYGSRRVATNVTFYRPSRNPLRRLEATMIPPAWVRREYIEPSRRQICTQFRAPYEEKQTRAGSQNGINVIVTGITSDTYPVEDADISTAAIDVHINVVSEKQYNDTIFFIEPHTYIPVGAGTVSGISYESSELVRVKGWGPVESRSCSNTVVPRAACMAEVVLNRTAQECECRRPENVMPPYFDRFGEENIMWCSASDGTPQSECVQDSVDNQNTVSLNECPVQCHSTRASIRDIIQSKLSDSQTEFIKTYLNYSHANQSSVLTDGSIVTEESVIIQIGVSSLFLTKYEQSPKVALASLLGQIGGNAGLWCGLSFVLMLETIEFIIVALLYGGGFYAGGRKPMRERIKSIAKRKHP